jgi:hypothetical protein
VQRCDSPRARNNAARAIGTVVLLHCFDFPLPKVARAMLVFIGSKLYGKVDHVPGLFYVATKFVYFQFIPLVPVGSFVVMEGTEKEDGKFSGVSVGLSAKSILVAWLRTALVIGAILAPTSAIQELIAVAQGRGDAAEFAGSIALTVGCIFGLWASYRFIRAGPIRALKLAGKAGVPPETVARFFVDDPAVAELEQKRAQEM